MTVDFGSVNWLAVAVAGVAAFMLAGVWYTALFGKLWQKAHHLDEEMMKKMQSMRPMPVFLAMQLVCYFAVAIGLALLVTGIGINSAGGGATLGALVWLVVAAVMCTNHLPTMTTWTGYFIDVSCAAVYCVGSGALLGAWR